MRRIIGGGSVKIAAARISRSRVGTSFGVEPRSSGEGDDDPKGRCVIGRPTRDAHDRKRLRLRETCQNKVPRPAANHGRMRIYPGEVYCWRGAGGVGESVAVPRLIVSIIYGTC